MLKKIGDKLYLSLQLFNGPDGTSERVFVSVRDQDNNLIYPETEVPHIQKGFFSESTFTMPGADVAFAFFEIREPDGVTISCEHNYQAQRFDRDFTGESINSQRPIIGGTVVGLVENNDISYQVKDLNNVTFEIQDPDDIERVIDSGDVIGIIESNEITGGFQ